jgi:hypothetical protein
MKTKTFVKKLILNKKTVTNLDNLAMNDVQGGAINLSRISYCVGCPTVTTCNTCAPVTCNCTGNTYQTCNDMMCTTVYPFKCQ